MNEIRTHPVTLSGVDMFSKRCEASKHTLVNVGVDRAAASPFQP